MFETQAEAYQSVPLKCFVRINALAYSVQVPMTRKNVFMPLDLINVVDVISVDNRCLRRCADANDADEN
jgi:hypothetical protein